MAMSAVHKCTAPCGAPRVARTARLPVVCNANALFKKTLRASAASLALAAGLTLAASPALATIKGSVAFASPANNTTISGPVHVEMEVAGLQIKPASEGLQAGTGHFHLLIDSDLPDEGDIIPFDATHKHYGKGQTVDDVELAPGKHKLTLQFANALHESYGPRYSKTITVTVE